jgi:hypothetical protein
LVGQPQINAIESTIPPTTTNHHQNHNRLGEIRQEVQAVQHSNEQATAQMSRIIKKAARELVGSHKLIQYREREKKEKEQEQRLLGSGPAGRQPSEGQQGAGAGAVAAPGKDGSPKKTRVEGPAAQLPEEGGGGAGASDGGSDGGSEGEVALTDEELLDSLLPSVHCEEGEAYPMIEGGAYEKKVEELAEVLNDLLPAEAVEPLRVVGEGQGSARQLEDRQVGCGMDDVGCGIHWGRGWIHWLTACLLGGLRRWLGKGLGGAVGAGVLAIKHIHTRTIPTPPHRWPKS